MTCSPGGGLEPFIEVSLSNEDVARPKPDPEIYQSMFERLGVRATSA